MASSFAFQRLPALVNRRAARRRSHASQPFEDFGPVLRRAMAQDRESAVRAQLSNRPRLSSTGENDGLPGERCSERENVTCSVGFRRRFGGPVENPTVPADRTVVLVLQRTCRAPPGRGAACATRRRRTPPLVRVLPQGEPRRCLGGPFREPRKGQTELRD